MKLSRAIGCWLLLAVACQAAYGKDGSDESDAPPKIQIVELRAGAVDGSPKGAATGSAQVKRNQPVAPSRTPPDKLLVSSSDLEITLARSSYDAVVARRAAKGDDLQLYLNGVNVTAASELVSEAVGAEKAILRYRIGSGESIRPLWAAVYRAVGLHGDMPLQVTLGWTSKGVAWSEQNPPDLALRIAVAPALRETLTWVLVIGFLVVSVLLALFTNLIRDPDPDWLAKAKELKKEMAEPGAGKDAVLSAADPAFSRSNAGDFAKVAASAAAGEVVTPADATKAAVGLADNDKELPRPTYSLARLQLYLWFVFAIGTGLFLWLVYGELLPITGSLVAMVAISAVTKQASTALDAKDPKGQASATASKDILRDTMTGRDDEVHVHRYQALLVNLLLLGVGVDWVSTQLAFPVFDGTWLAFLGVSGAVQAGGKQGVEVKK